MLITDAEFYLPISHQTLSSIIDNDAENFEEVVFSLSVSQIAALIFLNNLSDIQDHQLISLERVLAKTLAICNGQMFEEGLHSVIAKIFKKIEKSKIKEGYETIAGLKIALLDEEEIKEKKYLTVVGDWDFSFSEKYKEQLLKSLVQVNLTNNKNRTLSSEQSRVYLEIKGQLDDHMHVQGYAGTGKSTLIKTLLNIFESTNAQVLVLAQRKNQLDGLLAGVDKNEHVHVRTFSSLMYKVIPNDLTSKSNQHMLRRTASSAAPMPYNEVIEHFNIHDSGNFSSIDIVKAARGTVYNFCCSDDGKIEKAHLPNWSTLSLDEVSTQVVLHIATEMWKEIVSPSSNKFKSYVRGYHRIKYAAINRWYIPNYYTHVLIDESHDLVKPMLQILDCSSQAVISLGDEYQNLQGNSQKVSSLVRQREVTNSIRSGCLVESLVNPIIKIHPGNTKSPFQGNKLYKTEVEYYRKPQVPQQSCTVLVSDSWELFEWIQRMVVEEDIKLKLLISKVADLNMFVNDCIELFNYGTKPRHGELFKFSSWEAIVNKYHHNNSFQRINQMLEKGYSYNDWKKTLERINKSENNTHMIGFIEDVRNHEFDMVMLAPNVSNIVWSIEPANLAMVSSSVYVAVTRAKSRLLVPEGLRNWIEEISSNRNLLCY